jgi:DnaJ-class molecular chaperone
MKKNLLLLLIFVCISTSQTVFSQTNSIKTVYTEQKCDELIHRLSDSLMKITGDVSENYLKINEMTNRVTHQFVSEFEKDLGKPVKGDDLKFLMQQSKKCINEPTKGGGANLCSSCLGSGYRMCDYCHGRASEPCKICNATGFILSNGYKIGCVQCQSTGYRNCLKCNGKADLKCVTCNGTGHVK